MTAALFFAAPMTARALLLFSILSSLVAMAADAQVTLSGSVVDPSGAAVANASVSLTSRTQRVPMAAITDDAGDFQIAGLAAGRYELVVNSNDTFHVLRRTIEVTATSAPLVLRLSLPGGS